MRDRIKAWLWLPVAATALAGCGGAQDSANEAMTGSGGEGAAAAGPGIDPCSLLSAAEMAAITTDPVIGTERQDASCTYRSNPNDGVQVTVMASGGAKQMEVVHQTAKLLGGMGAAVSDKGGAGGDVAGMLTEDKSAAPKLGDEAVWGANTTLSVRKGDVFVEVTPPLLHDPATHPGYPMVKPDEKRAIAVAVATKLLVKLH